MKTEVGFIGLGNMGSGMTRNLLSSGYTVIGFDTDKRKVEELISFGLKEAKNAKDIAKTSETVILCLPHPDVTQQVILDELLVEGNTIKTVIETSTLTPEFVIKLKDQLSAKDKNFLSAPMIGGKNSANNKTIHLLVEGKKELFDQYLPLIQAMGKRVDYMGDAPSATLAKLSFNLSRYTNLAVGVEIYRLLQKYGANTKAVYDFMSEQSLDNFGQVWREDLKKMMTEDIPFKPSQVPNKDLTLLSDMAREHELNDELIKAVRNTYLSLE